MAGWYQQQPEDLNHICNWASLKGQVVVLLGDLNLDRLRPDKIEGKLLINTEQTDDMEFMIIQLTRVQT